MDTQNPIFLTNSKTRKKERFVPIDPKNVRLYLCGPTVYDRAHLGNARPVLVFDVLQRLLRHVYGADHVTYVRNFTDVDDKINATAMARKEAGAQGTLEELVHERSSETIDWYHQDMDALGAARPDHEPRATEYIDQMVTMIADLIAKGHAYEAKGHVLFRVRSYKDYGQLSGRSVDDMIAGARVEVAPFKEDPMDFVLWKPSTDDLPGWPSPWGRGRPGWHIECSAMADDLLWKKPLKQGRLSDAALARPHEFDIHGGGNDLTFPHHENEIAQSCCAHSDNANEVGFANVWLHNEMLQVEGKKMSKSLGNFFTVRDLLDQGIPGEVIRFVMLSTHYRKPMDWTEKKAQHANSTLDSFVSQTVNMEPAKDIPVEFLEALADDLNTSKAITVLYSLAKAKRFDELLASLLFLGFDFSTLDGGWVGNNTSRALEELVFELEKLRAEAMETKDFSQVDRLKTALIDAGVEVRMSKAGVELVSGPNFDAAKLEGL
ncbi:cysteine--tRNA ligase [Pelagimonas varians]|uniref:Cysteine--tRNA ligase n=1 Tax=Pelagimonas varians TaxID=696760 RepID=A0A238KDF6_9RHOB|nr:cysteine--tRNA ligase [Pelagimonas varians]PYG29880.1 cysteinyl-tRNA synthetase [Pelagimonas varians]SMX40881.1 Cysteine--tRNA ligase [Pelagimonas varians]